MSPAGHEGGPPVALTIAGSDSGCGAGIQADLKTFAALQVFGLSAVTAVTAQSTAELRGLFPVPAEALALQLETLFADFRVGAVKIGMLPESSHVAVVAAFARDFSVPLVVDPVRRASTGSDLVDQSAFTESVAQLFPLATLVTPNLDETEAILGQRPRDVSDMVEAGKCLLAAFGTRAALVKGGHLDADPTDVLVARGSAPRCFEGARITGVGGHGTGCTYASAIAAYLARGEALAEAVSHAHRYVRRSLEASAFLTGLGHGRGPLHHFHAYYSWS